MKSQEAISDWITWAMCIVLLLMFASFHANGQVVAQDLMVSGRVTDGEDGKPIPGVNVLIKGTDQGTITDSDGVYHLVGALHEKVLVFSFVGMQTQEINVSQRTVVDVKLQQDVKQLSEIVVTGSGVATEKRMLAFSIESVKTSSLPVVPTGSIDHALIGRIPGAQISSINGTPGAEVSILLRGINTLNRGTMPMILVDGVQMGATTLSNVDPNSIERVEVIQGAAASSIYGAQGANGVIQLFTKRGSKGKPQIEFSTGISWNEFLNVGGLRKANLHAFETNDSGEVLLKGDSTSLLTQDDTTLFYNGSPDQNLLFPNSLTDKPYDRNLTYHDHFKDFFKPAHSYNARVGISGATEDMDYNVQVSKTRQESNFYGDGFNDRSNLNLNLGVRLAKGLHLRSVTQMVYNYNTINVWEKQDFYLNGNFMYMLNTQPFADFSKTDTDGDHGAYYGSGAGANQFNPNYEFQYAATQDKKLDILQSLSLQYSPSRFVDMELLYGLNFQDRTVRHEIQNQSHNNNSNAGHVWTAINNQIDNAGEIDVWESTRTFQNVKATATVHLDFDKDFKLGIPLTSSTQVAFDYRSDDLHRYQSYALGMPELPPITASQGTSFNVPEDYREEFVTYGYLVSQRFNYGELAGISGGFRTDFSSAFGKGSDPFTFPRADGFFRVTALDFWEKSPVLRQVLDWKLRAAYGEAGIQPRPFDRYVTLSTKLLGNSNALFVGSNQSNPDLDVEVSREFEAGTDISVDGLKGDWLKDFHLSFTYWKRATDNAIFRVDAPPSVGIGSVLNNAVALDSKGLQLSLRTGLLKSQGFNWNMTVNWSRQASRYGDLQGGEIISGGAIMKTGEAVGTFYGRLMLHNVDERDPDGVLFIPDSLAQYYSVASNGWVVNDTTKQPFFTAEQYALGNPNPDFMTSVINDITFRNFLTLSFQFDWLRGQRLYNQTRQWLYRDGIHSDYEKPITIAGEEGAWSAFYRGAYTGNISKNYFFEDASFVRLRTISLAADLGHLFKLQKVNKLQLILTGRNLWTLTTYSGMDPEINTYAADYYGGVASSLDRGVDNSVPNFRSWHFTFIIGF